MAPVRIPVEIRWTREKGRLYRLSSAIDPEAIQLERAVPMPAGEPARLCFVLPDDSSPILAGAELAGREARFTALEGADRTRIVAYVRERLGLS